ncbi:MAG: DUF937 domain-containing protein [Planctomycetaceae bacterium]
MNLVDTLLKSVGGDVGQSLAGLLGEGEGKTEMAVKAAVPALLAALTGASATREGAERLASAVEGADEGLLGSLGAMLGSQGAGLAQKGESMLGSLFAGGMLGNLSGAIAKFTGMSPQTITRLLATLTPIVLGFLKRETKSSGFDPGALTRLLASQKDNIASALPAGLRPLLGGIPGLDQFARLAETARDTLGDATNRAALVGREARSAVEGAAAMRWVAPLVLLLGALALAWYFLAPRENPADVAARQQPIGDTTVTAKRVSDDVARAGGVGLEAEKAMGDLRTALMGVTDAASAEKAAPRLDELIDQIITLQQRFQGLAGTEQRGVVDVVSKLREGLLAQIEQVLKIPGVNAVLAEPMARLRRALEAFS